MQVWCNLLQRFANFFFGLPVAGCGRLKLVLSDDTSIPPEHRLPRTAPAARSDEALLKLLEALPEGQKEVILMLKVSGMTLEEVARATSCTVGAVKQKAHRAYQKLRIVLG